MASWTMAVEAVPPVLAAAAVEDGEVVAVRTDLRDGDADVVTSSLLSAVQGHDTYPDALVMVVPGDIAPERFAALAEAAGLAGLPDPSWLPDAVARAGETIASWPAGCPAVVVDARGQDVVAWAVRPTPDGIRIAEDGPANVSAHLDDLLAGVVQAKLSVVAPAFAQALRRRDDAPARRDAAHLVRELRMARRLLSESDGEELVVSIGTAEVTITRAEFSRLAEHALREVVVELHGVDASDDVRHVVVADRSVPIVEHLTRGTRAPVLLGPTGDGARWGVAALVRPRTAVESAVEPVAEVDGDTATDGVALVDAPPVDSPGELASVPPPRTPEDRRRARWAVLTVTSVLALVTAGSAAFLAADLPASDASTPALPTVIPAGLGAAR